MKYIDNKVNWENHYGFSFECYIGEKSHITQFMAYHKMFPGNKIIAYTEMRSMRHKWKPPYSLDIKVRILNQGQTIDEFVVKQGTFCKIMSNIYCDRISKMIN